MKKQDRVGIDVSARSLEVRLERGRSINKTRRSRAENESVGGEPLLEQPHDHQSQNAQL